MKNAEDIEGGKEKKMTEILWDIQMRIDTGRYKLGIIQELFSAPPCCDGYKEPKDLGLFYLGVETILEEIMNENTNASEKLSDLFFAERKKEEVTA